MQIVTWNVRRADARSRVWDHLLAADPEVLLLQEVGGIPPFIVARYQAVLQRAATKQGGHQRFSTAILTKYAVVRPIAWTATNEWIAAQAAFFSGNMVGAVVRRPEGGEMSLVSVYSPAWPIERSKWANMDVSGLKLANNSDIWCTEILCDVLRNSMANAPSPWVVGGDFNSSETFDFIRGDRGNREIMRRLEALGLWETLRRRHGKLVPTFKNTDGGKIIHQMDHLYVSEELCAILDECEVGDQTQVFLGGLSDHLPITARFGG